MPDTSESGNIAAKHFIDFLISLSLLQDRITKRMLEPPGRRQNNNISTQPYRLSGSATRRLMCERDMRNVGPLRAGVDWLDKCANQRCASLGHRTMPPSSRTYAFYSPHYVRL